MSSAVSSDPYVARAVQSRDAAQLEIGLAHARLAEFFHSTHQQIRLTIAEHDSSLYMENER